MIGQRNNKEFINNLIANNKLPRFLIISGTRVSGKTTLSKYIAKQLTAPLIEAESGVNGVRDIISQAYKSPIPICYLIRHADELSKSALNALLKVTEEPPKQAYFILTTNNYSNLLDTLKSRGTTIRMEPYSRHELWKLNKDGQLLDYCSNIGEMKEILETDTKLELIKFCNSVLDNISRVTLTNALKIGSHLAFKETDTDKYSVSMFFNILTGVCKGRMIQYRHDDEELFRYIKYHQIIREYATKMQYKSIKKDALFDRFIIDMWGLMT